MSELRLIESMLRSAARRRRWARALQGLGRGLLVGALVYLASLAAYKVFPVPASVPWIGLTAGLGTALLGFLLGGWRAESLDQTARWVDVKQNLKERLSTALEVAARPDAADWRSLVVADAIAHVRQVDPRRLVPLRLTRAGQWAGLVLLMAFGLGFVPEYRSSKFLQQQAETKNIREVGKQLATLTKQSLENRPPALEATQKSLENVENLGQKLTRASLTRSDALRDLAAMTDKVQAQLREKLEQAPALRRLEAAANAPGGPNAATAAGLQKQIDALKRELGGKTADPAALDKFEKDLEKLQAAAKGLASQTGNAGDATREKLSQSLSALAQQAGGMGLNLPDLDKAIAALAANQTDLFLKDLQAAAGDLEKLKQMAQTLQQLQAQAASKLGKDLAEQLKFGQAEAAQATLQKMVEQLQSAKLSPEQLQQMLEDVDKAAGPAKPYGKVADFLKHALSQGRQGDKPAAAQSLADAAKELEKLRQQFGDAEAMMAALDALKEASQCIGTGQGWGVCPACGGKGCSQCQGRGWSHGKGPGSGVGTWADEGSEWNGDPTARWDNSDIARPDMDPRGVTDRGEGTLSDALKPTQAKGQFSPGAPMPSITLKGVSIRGTSKVQLEEATTAAQTDAQAALNQDKVPKAYQNQVKDYFDDLKK